jgi:alpha-D-ribose 1-methylphosphonate 5-triphosphate diphosphatase PhnM
MIVIILNSTLYDKDFQSVTCDRLVVFSRYSHMKREIFASLCRDLEASLAPSDHAVRDVVDVQKQVAITLHWLVSSA